MILFLNKGRQQWSMNQDHVFADRLYMLSYNYIANAYYSVQIFDRKRNTERSDCENK